MYGMEKTTVYLPADLKRALSRTAAARGQSEAELIREALRAATAQGAMPRPRLPLFASRKPRLAERIEEALAGFGEA
jgi:plasmid stability protein